MKKRIFFLLGILLFFLCSPGSANGAEKNAPVKMEKNALLIDVRTPEEFAAGHLKGAVNIPAGNIDLLQKKGAKKDSPLYLYCRSGRRVKAAIKDLKKEGYTCLYDFGGMKEAGKRLSLPVVK